MATLIQNTRGEIVYGGTYDREALTIEPTIIVVSEWSDIGMREETFGPVLWLKSVRSVSEAVAYINARPKP